MSNRFLVPGTIKQGYLTKSPPLDKNTAMFKGWKKRWVILYLSQGELFLQYYENEESARGSSPPKSTVSLRFCGKVDVDLEHSTYKNVFSIHLPERTYYFSAPSHFEMKEWGDTICTHLQINEKSTASTLPISSQLAYAGNSSTMPLAGSGTYGLAGSGTYGLAGAGTYGLAGSGTYGLAGSGTYGLAGAGTYGLAGSGTYGLAGAGTYGLARSGTYGLAGSGTYGLAGSGTYGLAGAGMNQIQQRNLPAIPQQNIETTPTNISSPPKDGAPPIPPRFHSTEGTSNLYSITPTR